MTYDDEVWRNKSSILYEYMKWKLKPERLSAYLMMKMYFALFSSIICMRFGVWWAVPRHTMCMSRYKLQNTITMISSKWREHFDLAEKIIKVVMQLCDFFQNFQSNASRNIALQSALLIHVFLWDCNFQSIKFRFPFC